MRLVFDQANNFLLKILHKYQSGLWNKNSSGLGFSFLMTKSLKVLVTDFRLACTD